MLLLGYTFQVKERVTLGDLILTYLKGGMKGYTAALAPSGETLDALADEIWQAPENKHLRSSSPENTRGHNVQQGAARTSTLFIYPDEFLYLPFLDGSSMTKPVKIGIDTSSAEDASSTIELWLDEQEAASGFQGGVRHISAEHLKGYVLNSLLRQGKTAKEVYFFVEPEHIVLVDAAPTTKAGGKTPNNGRATPAWFLPLWGWIDRLRNASDNHIKIYNALMDVVGQARMVTALMGSIDQLMTVMEDKLKAPPPPTGFLARAGQGLSNMYTGPEPVQSISGVHAQVKSLRALSKSELVEKVPFPEKTTFEKSGELLARLELDADFAKHYTAFTLERKKFPLTEKAMTALATTFVQARVLSPDCDDVTKRFVSAFLDKALGPTPMTQQVAAVFDGRSGSEYVGDALSSTMALVGNAPGPMALWVAMTKISLLAEIRKISVLSGASGKPYKADATTLKRYLDRLTAVSGLDEATLKALEAKEKAQPLGKLSKAVARRITAAEEVAGATQSGPGFMKFLSVMNLILIYTSFNVTMDDLKKLEEDPDNYWRNFWGVAGDVAGLGATSINLSADVLALLAQSPEARAGIIATARTAAAMGVGVPAGKIATIINNAKPLSEVAGKFAAVAGIVVGTLQIIQGATKDGKGERDWAKISQGIGSLLISAGYFADVLVTRLGPRLLVRMGLAEIGVLAMGESAALLLGSCLTVVGILVTLAVVVYANQEPINRFFKTLTTPGTQKFVEAVLTWLKTCQAVKTGSPAVLAAIDSTLAASQSARYVNWTEQAGGIEGLKKIGFSDDDITFIRQAGVPIEKLAPMPVMGMGF